MQAEIVAHQIIVLRAVLSVFLIYQPKIFFIFFILASHQAFWREQDPASGSRRGHEDQREAVQRDHQEDLNLRITSDVTSDA